MQNYCEKKKGEYISGIFERPIIKLNIDSVEVSVRYDYRGRVIGTFVELKASSRIWGKLEIEKKTIFE